MSEITYHPSNIKGYCGHIVVMGVSSRPKGRINPHCGVFTRKGNGIGSKSSERKRRYQAKLDLVMGGQS